MQVTSPVARRASPGYLATFAAAMVGMVLLATALVGTMYARAGSDPLDAFNAAGVPALIFALALGYVFRLIFSPKVSAATQANIRLLTRVIFAIEVIAGIGIVWFVLKSGVVPGEIRAMAILGALAQIGTAIWLVRYSAE